MLLVVWIWGGHTLPSPFPAVPALPTQLAVSLVGAGFVATLLCPPRSISSTCRCPAVQSDRWCLHIHPAGHVTALTCKLLVTVTVDCFAHCFILVFHFEQRRKMFEPSQVLLESSAVLCFSCVIFYWIVLSKNDDWEFLWTIQVPRTETKLYRIISGKAYTFLTPNGCKPS